jgi:hypothetical protein
MDEEPINRRRLLDDIIPDEAVQHARAAREEMLKSLEAFLPRGFVEHRRAARKEMLLAMRSLIDAAIERTEKRERQTAEPPSAL